TVFVPLIFVDIVFYIELAITVAVDAKIDRGFGWLLRGWLCGRRRASVRRDLGISVVLRGLRRRTGRQHEHQDVALLQHEAEASQGRAEVAVETPSSQRYFLCGTFD